MGKWTFRHEGDWLFRIRAEAKKIAIRANTDELQGSELELAILDLIQRAVKYKPVTIGIDHES